MRVYLSGEIHTDWRERIERGAEQAGLDVEFTGPVTDHAASDDAGVAILGDEEKPFSKDHLGAGVNAVRTRTLLERADVVVVRFGEQYKQWNAAFDAGYAAALGKPLVTLHPEQHDHALKEVDRAALAVAREPEQAQRGVPRELAEADHDACVRQLGELGSRPRLDARVALGRRRLVRRRRAADRRGDPCAEELQAVAAVRRGRLVRQTGAVQRGEEEVARAVAG